MDAKTTITLRGVKVGTIWMPAATCHKHFEERYSPTGGPFMGQWTGLRDALVDIAADGDFRSCDIADLSIEVRRPTRNGFNVTYHDVKRCRAIADVYDPSRMDDVICECE